MDFKLSETQEMFRRAIRDFCEKEIRPVAQKLDEEEKFPYEIYDKLIQLGLPGIPFPEKYGGAGGDWLTWTIAFEEISRISAGVAMAEAYVLFAPPIYFVGNEEQKQKYLPAVIRGEIKGCFALSEPNAGSDAASIQLAAEEKQDCYLLNGNKIFATNASVSDYMVVAARTGPEKTGHQGVSLLIVDSHSKGITMRDFKNKLGVRAAPTGEVAFDNVAVPKENLLGEKGKGFYHLMESLTVFRILFGAIGLGVAIGAFEEALSYAKGRVQFGQPIGKFQAVQFMLADMYTSIEASRLLLYRAAWMQDHNIFPCDKEASAGKLMASEAAMNAGVKGMEIYGGYGYVSNLPIQRYFRDAKVMEVGEGTSEIQRTIIARRLGL